MKVDFLRIAIKLFETFCKLLDHKGMIKVKNEKKNSIIESVVIKGKWNGNKYIIIKKIGMGGIGEVYKVIDEKQKIYALKISKDVSSITREYNILWNMKSIDFVPNVYEIDDYIENENTFYFFVMEYINGTCLNKYISGIKYNIEKLEKLTKIIAKLSVIMENIYNLGYIYVDIKPQNIIISKNRKRIFLIDFGGVIRKDCSIKEYTPTYNIVSWRLNFKMKDIESIIFSLSMLMASLIYNKEFNPLVIDISRVKDIIKRLDVNNYVKQVISKGLSGKYNNFYSFREDLLYIFNKKTNKSCRNKYKIDIIDVVLVFSIIFFVVSLALLRL